VNSQESLQPGVRPLSIAEVLDSQQNRSKEHSLWQLKRKSERYSRKEKDMTISERTLRKWRKEALRGFYPLSVVDNEQEEITEMNKRILKMTQELLDQHLLRK